MPRPLRNRLTFRLGVGLGLAATLILIAAGWWNLQLQRAHLTRLVISSATDRVDDIRRSIREAMMRNSPSEVQRIIETIADQPTITGIRLYDKRGRIRTSTHEAEIGSPVDKHAEECISCHGPEGTLERLEREDRARIFAAPDGGRILAVISPIRNETSCAQAACHAHPASQKILGVLDLQLSLSQVDRDLAASERQMILGLLGTVVAVLVSAWLLTWRLVLRPVERLTRAATRVAAGELSTHITSRSNDEIGEMTRAWNSMIAKLGRAQIVLERWGRTLQQTVEEKTTELETAHQQMLRVEKMASLGQLSAVVAHEINNPLTGIATYARLLRRRRARTAANDDDGETQRILGLIEEEANRCGEIARNLLLFGRTPAAAYSRADLAALLERCILLLRPQAESEQVELRLEVDPELPAIDCDPSQIQQMILALGLNAIEATPPGGRVEIAVDRPAAEERVTLTVRDTGRGIAEEDLERVFEPFFTTKQEGRGVGLGLPVVYGIVRRHDGSIDVDSPPGGGATFTVHLPLRQTAAQKEEIAEVS